MSTLRGVVVQGCGHFTVRMTKFEEVFRKATGESLVPGTLNIEVARPIPIKVDIRITGEDINEPEQDLLIEKCAINGIPAYRIRPYNLTTGGGGHGDHILEIACSKRIANATVGSPLEVTLFRDIDPPDR